MKKVLTAILMTAAIASPLIAVAGTQANVHQNHGAMKGLELTASQKTQMQSVMKTNKLNRENFTQLQQKETLKKLNGFLSTEQVAKVEKRMEARKFHRLQKSTMRGKHGHGNRFKALNLTSEQQVKVKALVKQNRTEMHQSMKLKRAENQAKVAKLLTPAQVKILKAQDIQHEAQRLQHKALRLQKH